MSSDSQDEKNPLSLHPIQGMKSAPIDFLGYLQLQASSIRAKQINWLPYLQNKSINREQCIFITLYQEAEDKAARENIVNFFGPRSFECFLTILNGIFTTEVLQKVTILIDDMLYEDIKKVNKFYKVSKEIHGKPPFKPFLALLHNEDGFVKNVASRILSKLVTYHRPRMFGDDLDFYLGWLKDNLNEDNKYIHSVLRCLQRMCKHQTYRSEIMHLGVTNTMIGLLSDATGHQTQYQLGFCIWLATFDEILLEKVVDLDIIPIMSQVLGDCPPEYAKLHRVILATFRNLVQKPLEREDRKQNALMLVQCGVVKYMNLLELRTYLFKDEEFAEDYQVVSEALQDIIKDMTSFGEYYLELKSGKLEWSVVHTSAKFWKENAHRFNEKKYEMLKTLIRLLERSDSPTVLSVACFDLGEYMKNYPRGRKIIMELGGKDILVGLLEHDHDAVKFNALKTTQILMLNNCHILEKNLKGSSSVHFKEIVF